MKIYIKMLISQPNLGHWQIDIFFSRCKIECNMSFLPKVRKCPQCGTFNFLKTNGIAYDNEFQTLKEWQLKSKTHCRKCKIELGLFINIHDEKKEKFAWIDFIRCEEYYLKKLAKLQRNKEKYIEKNKQKELIKTVKEIQDIQNQIRLSQVKLKVKTKIENKGLFI